MSSSRNPVVSLRCAWALRIVCAVVVPTALAVFIAWPSQSQQAPARAPDADVDFAQRSLERFKGAADECQESEIRGALTDDSVALLERAQKLAREKGRGTLGERALARAIRGWGPNSYKSGAGVRELCRGATARVDWSRIAVGAPRRAGNRARAPFLIDGIPTGLSVDLRRSSGNWQFDVAATVGGIEENVTALATLTGVDADAALDLLLRQLALPERSPSAR